MKHGGFQMSKGQGKSQRDRDGEVSNGDTRRLSLDHILIIECHYRIIVFEPLKKFVNDRYEFWTGCRFL